MRSARVCDFHPGQEMLMGPFRKFRKIWPIVVFFGSICFMVAWRRAAIDRENQIHPKHIYRNNQEEYIDSRGIHVVIGHYIGHSEDKIPNATYAMINANNFKPRPNAGKNGSPVVVEPKDLLRKQQLFQVNKFNLIASDLIPLNRTLPDVRRKKCSVLYDDYLTYPKASIIIVFHNEAWSTLLRTVWSVINRTPPELLEEIILVDDASEREFLRKPLEDHINSLPIPASIIRSKERIGLVKARMRGASVAKGDVLTFLDAHCECTKGWLEPLLAVIKEDPSAVVCPVIDIINDDTFAYVKSFELHWGAFNWNLQFRWFTLGAQEMKVRKKDTTLPFHTPTMAGGLFAIDKKYFFEVGAYDWDMNIWGGENLEMSFRIWQCGGKVMIAPCSHVGHVFRKSSPYSFPGGISNTLFSNLARVALVWMDDWAEFYFKFNPIAEEIRHKVNVSSRLNLRRKMHCRGFEWYLDNVWPQHFLPKNDRFFGKIRNAGKDLCLIRPDRSGNTNQPMGIAKLEECMGDDVSIEMFVMTQEGVIMTDDSVCLDAPEKTVLGLAKVRIMACSGLPRQQWVYDKKTLELKHKTNKQCLDISKDKKFSEGLIITECNGSKTQMWKLQSVSWK